jgi:hypothetical protein
MIKFVSIILTVVLALTCLCSCGAKVECDFCDAKYPERKGHTGEAFGETYHMCPECYSDFKSLS